MFLRAEGAVALVASVLGYATQDWGWLTFAILFLAPDLGMLGYLGGSRLGAATYNAVHTYLGPAVLAATGWLAGVSLLPAALIWTAHIGFDRMLGYGLKYPTEFTDTHVGRIGRQQDLA